MALKDPEKRREYDRNYRRWWRRRKRLATQDRGLMIYLMWGVNFSIIVPGQGRIVFHGGFHVTDDLTQIKSIESHPKFGRNIFPLKMDLGQEAMRKIP